MPIVGIVCPMDNSFQTFQHCIDCHENRSRERNCEAPVFVLKTGRDNGLHRKGAGWSASTLLSCPRAVAIEDRYDLYEPVISMHNKARGSWVHAMVEADIDPPSWIIREVRLRLDIHGTLITGKPDEVDTKYHVLVDYKSKDNLPLRPDDQHEFQFNVYAHLLRNGEWAEDAEQYGIRKGDKANVEIDVIAAHYITWKTKYEKAFKKKAYPVWDNDYTQSLIEQRMEPLKEWQTTGELPACSPYLGPKPYPCQCTKWEQQLQERGIPIE